ncbi:MAG: HAD family hydrolase [Candidatus Verstraetearchaeota archaeon]|nr:HAD family hydrolase [Candidatus Verstraetearchaeota archaeon]
MRKAVVLDKSGTIIDPCRIVYNLETGKWLFHVSTLKYVVEKGGVLVNLRGSASKIMKGDLRGVQLKVSCCAVDPVPRLDRYKLEKPSVVSAVKSVFMKANEHCSSELGACVAVVFDSAGDITDIVGLGGRLYSDVRGAVSEMRREGVDVYLATGNCREMTLKCAEVLGMPKYAAIFDASPEDKRALVRRLRGFYGAVIMVGNDINDLTAMREADIAILVLRDGSSPREKLETEVDYLVGSLTEVAEIVSSIRPI